MQNDRQKKLIELIGDKQTCGYMDWWSPDTVWRAKTTNEELAVHLLANGVTFATDTNDGAKMEG